MKLLSPTLLGLIVYFVVSMTAIANESFIKGPVPAVVVAPLADTVEFTCEVNTTTVKVIEVFWQIGSQLLVTEDVNVWADKIIKSTLSVEVTISHLFGGLIQCGVFWRESGSISKIYSTTNATLTAYGTVLVY